MTEGVLPPGWHLTLEVDSGRHMNWKAVNGTMPTVFTRSKSVDLTKSKEVFADELAKAKKAVLHAVSMIEGNINQTPFEEMSSYVELDMEIKDGDEKIWFGYIKCPGKYARRLPEFLRERADEIESEIEIQWDSEDDD